MGLFPSACPGIESITSTLKACQSKQEGDGSVEISITQAQGRVPVTVLHPTGDLTGYNYQEFETQARDVIKAGTTHLLLDLTDVGYISSAGLRALHYISSLLPEYRRPAGDASHKAPRRSPYLKLYNPSKRALQALQLVGFDEFFEVYYDLDEAVASF
jgi:anti-anti-sigma regulatory factor